MNKILSRRKIKNFPILLLGLVGFLLLAQPVQAGNSSIFTVSAWVKPEGSVASKAIVAKAEELRMFTDNSGYLGCQIKSTSWQTAAQATSNALPLNTWSFVACTYDKANLKVFVNGVQVASQALTATVDDTANALKYGVDDSASSPYGAFQGTIDEMKFYNYARTEKQIVEDMNAGHPAPGSPIGSAVVHYKFDEGYGSTANNSGSGGMSLNGTLGAGSSAPSWTNEGKFGKALSFDGGDEVTSTISDPGYYNTISLWLNPKTSIASKTLVTDGKLTTDSSSRPVYGECTGTAIPLDQWTHLVAVSDGSGVCKIYQNGKQTASSTTGVSFGTSVNIGAGSYIGIIDEVKIYNYALSEEEIKAEYNRGSGMVMGSLSDTSGLSGGEIASNSASAEYCVPGDTSYCAPPVGRWDFEEGQGNTVYDTSGNGNNGTWNTIEMHYTTGKAGKAGKAIFNDSYQEYVTVPNISELTTGSGSFTLGGWFNISTFSAGSKLIAGKTGYHNGLQFSWGAPFFRLWNSDNQSFLISSTTPMVVKKWYYLTGQFDASTNLMRYYINGILQGENTFQGTMKNLGTNFRIGIIGSPGGNGYVLSDNVRLYPYFRTPAQIAWDYNRGKPVAHWKLDECSGTTIHSTNDPYNSSLDATLTIGASGSQTSAGTCASGNSTDAWYNGATGKFNSSLNFDGTDDRATTGNIALIAADSQTYSDVSWGAWVKASSNQTDKTIIHKNGEFRLYTDSNGYPTCQVGDTGNTAAASSALPNNTWSHLLCTYDGSNIKLYINGTLVASNSRTGTITSSSSTNINIAQKSDSSQRYGGQIDEVVIYNYALTPVLVRQLYNNGAAVQFGGGE